MELPRKKLTKAPLRRLLRESGLLLILAAAIAGAAGGAVAALMSFIVGLLHTVLFDLPGGVRLSAVNSSAPLRTLLILAAGGSLVGLASAVWRKRIRGIVDPIEANALYGGKMSAEDSAFVVAQSILSSGFGASLGLEGGFTQGASAIGSRLGMFMRRRRHDVRLLVGAGAAGAIAGAFNAPIAGAAYGYELIIGSYTIVMLAPVVAAALAGFTTYQSLLGPAFQIQYEPQRFEGGAELALLVATGIICGLLGVAVMYIATGIERLAKFIGLRREFRPLAGAGALAGLALITPHALGSGHGAIEMVFQSPWTPKVLGLVLAVKIIASAVSIGLGFRGGLFSTSLFLGALTGTLAGGAAFSAGWIPENAETLFTLVGMASLAAAVVGAPMTMALLAIEISNTLSVVSPVLIGVVASSVIVRKTFGYSFATWRFHLRGEAILGGEDIGWIRDMTARTLMRRDLTMVPATETVEGMLAKYAPGSLKIAAVVDDAGGVLGLVDIAALHAGDGAGSAIKEHIIHQDAVVKEDVTVDRLLPLFEQRETELLIVVDDLQSRRPLGYMSEAFALRRYRQELERRQREIFSGEP